MFDPIAYLSSKGHDGKRGASGEYSYPCFIGCGEDNPKKRKLYVNAQTGFFWCHVCQIKGGSYVLQHFFGDVEEDGPAASKRNRILKMAAEVGHAMLMQNDELLTYLVEQRALSPDTIVERQLGFVGNRWSLVAGLGKEEDLLETGLVNIEGPRKGQDFFYNHLLIPYFSDGRVVQMRGKALGGQVAGRYMTGPGERVRAFDEGEFAREELVLCEGEFDAIALKQMLLLSTDERVRRMGVAAIPGAGAVPPDFDDLVRQSRRVYIAFDSDAAGKAAAIKLKDRLGPKARVVELPEGEGAKGKTDWNELLREGWTWREAMKAIGHAPGRRLFSVAEAGEKWRQVRSTAVGAGMELGFDELDALLRPGLLPGQLMVVLAKTGTGKTIFLCNVAYNMRNIPTLFISLEQTREEVYERLARIYRFHHPHAMDEEIDNAFRKVAICDINRMTEETLASLVDEYEVEFGERPSNVMVDYLGYFARGVRGSTPYEKTSTAVMELKAMAKAMRVGMITPHQVNRTSDDGRPLNIADARDSGVIEETADFLFGLFRPDDAHSRGVESEPNGALRLQILKSRHGNKDRVVGLQMDLLTLAIVGQRDDQAKLAKEHTYLAWRGYTYDDLRKMQTEPRQKELL